MREVILAFLWQVSWEAVCGILFALIVGSIVTLACVLSRLEVK
jgi:hypothetical protein